MSYKYLNKRDEELIEKIKKDRKISKKALLWGFMVYL